MQGEGREEYWENKSHITDVSLPTDTNNVRFSIVSLLLFESIIEMFSIDIYHNFEHIESCVRNRDIRGTGKNMEFNRN